MGKTLLEHTLLSVKKAGITDVIIVVNKDNPIEEVLGDGNALGITITYAIQPEPLGMGDALLHAEPYITGDFFLTNANHVDFHEFYQAMLEKTREKDDIVLLGRKQEITGVYGCMQVEGDKVVGFIEKPTDIIQSSLRHIGIYLFTQGYLEILKQTPPDENHLEHAIDAYAKEGKVTFVETDKETLTLKYAWNLLGVKHYLLQGLTSYISPDADVSKHAIIDGVVYIESGAKVYEGACLKGPCYIGKNAVVGTNALVRGGTCLEENAVAGSYMEMTNTLMMNDSTTHSGFIGDSVIGSKTKIGAMICTANVRLDRKKVSAEVKEKKVDSQNKHLGAIVGDNVIFGAGVITMPGIIIGNDTLIGPSTTIMENVPDVTTYYTDFKTIITKKNRSENK
jgi:NDP-sugar pyrophosphorylase family protein